MGKVRHELGALQRSVSRDRWRTRGTLACDQGQAQGRRQVLAVREAHRRLCLSERQPQHRAISPEGKGCDMTSSAVEPCPSCDEGWRIIGKTFCGACLEERKRDMGWQSIETAPKDGTEILLARYDEDTSYYCEVGQWWVSAWAGGVGFDGLRSLAILSFEPTHWMPLPDPPPVVPSRPDRKEAT